MKTNRISWKARFSVFMWLFFFLASGTTAQVVKRDLADLSLRADVIVKARVERAESRWVDDGRGKHIYTYVTLNLIETMKGDFSSGFFTIELPGGSVGEQRAVVTESYSLHDGEKVILFLRVEPLTVVGGQLGILSIVDGLVAVGNQMVPEQQFVEAIKKVAANSPVRIFGDTGQASSATKGGVKKELPSLEQGTPIDVRKVGQADRPQIKGDVGTTLSKAQQSMPRDPRSTGQGARLSGRE